MRNRHFYFCKKFSIKFCGGGKSGHFFLTVFLYFWSFLRKDILQYFISLWNGMFKKLEGVLATRYECAVHFRHYTSYSIHFMRNAHHKTKIYGSNLQKCLQYLIEHHKNIFIVTIKMSFHDIYS